MPPVRAQSVQYKYVDSDSCWLAAILKATSVPAARGRYRNRRAGVSGPAIREQRPRLSGAMPAHIRQLYENNVAAPVLRCATRGVTDRAAKRDFESTFSRRPR